MDIKSSKAYSVLANKCPHCHEGDFFVTSNAFDLRNFAKMYDKCPICGEDFRREPGFYFGAAYVSYGLTVTIGIILFVLLYWLLGLSAWVFFGILVGVQIIFMPFFFRSSRLVWINWFVSYEENKISSNANKK
jgi:uncharacterized protein (DUF983 family)